MLIVYSLLRYKGFTCLGLWCLIIEVDGFILWLCRCYGHV